MEYEAVVFDNDGVLTTLTERALLEQAIQDAFAEHGVDQPAETDLEAMMSVTVDSVEQVCKRHGIDTHEFWQRREELVIQRQIDAMEAGEKTLYDDATGIGALDTRLGIVSNNQQQTIDHIVDQFELDWATVAYGREPTLEGVRRKKPTPYYLEQALADLGLPQGGTDDSTTADDVLYVGDSPKDLVAAKRAGVEAAFIRRSHRDGVELPHEPAHEVESLDALLDEIGG